MKLQIFSSEFDYAVKIITVLSSHSILVPESHLRRLGVPRSFSVDILGEMVKRGFVSSKEGRNGGYKLLVRGDIALYQMYGEVTWLKAYQILKSPIIGDSRKG